MNTTEYKGFNIYEINGRFCAQDRGEAKFKQEGYATLNTAKGAITKHLKEREAEYEQIKANREAQQPKSLGDVLREAVRLINTNQPEKQTNPVLQSRNKREGRFIGKIDQKNKREMECYRDSSSLTGKVWSARICSKTRKHLKAQLLKHRQAAKEFGIHPSLTMLQWSK